MRMSPHTAMTTKGSATRFSPHFGTLSLLLLICLQNNNNGVLAVRTFHPSGGQSFPFLTTRQNLADNTGAKVNTVPPVGDDKALDDFFGFTYSPTPEHWPPTNAPSWVPTEKKGVSLPTNASTEAPSETPSEAPSETPSEAPSIPPNDSPSDSPSDAPSLLPTFNPTSFPTIVETSKDTSTETPSSIPSVPPTTEQSLFLAPNTTDLEALTYAPDFLVAHDSSFNGTNATNATNGTDLFRNETNSTTSSPSYYNGTEETVGFPNGGKTQSPTGGSTEAGGTLISGQVSLQLNGIQEEFPGNTRTIFLASAQEFIASNSEGVVEHIRIMLIYQHLVSNDGSNNGTSVLHLRRTLQQQNVLQVDLGVEGIRYQQTDDVGSFESDFNKWLKKLFDAHGLKFVDLVLETAQVEGETFFDTFDSVVALEPMSAATPTFAPTSKYSDDVYQNASSNKDNGGNGNGVPLVVIIGVVCGGFLLLVVLAGIGKAYLMHKKLKGTTKHHNLAVDPSTSMPDSMESSAPPAQQAVNNRNNRNNRNIHTRPSAGENSVTSSNTELYTNSASHHNNYQRQLYDTDSQSYVGGTAVGDMSVMDNMSYAYSLEPGIEASVAGIPQGVPSSDASAMGFSTLPGDTSVASTTTGMSQFTFMKSLQITKNNALNTKNAKTTEILAPPGKLGIVIDTTLDGPVVHKVNPGSSLEGKLNSGDIIVAIDDVDTRAMSAASITALMVKTAEQRRKLTIIRATDRNN